jgi:uncharacterized protein YjbI with pentapeptide repeats
VVRPDIAGGGTTVGAEEEEQLVVDRVNGRPPAPTDETVTSADWYGDDLGGVAHERVLFQGLDMTEASGQGARFVDCTFRDSKLSCLELADSAFENCTFLRCSFFDSTLTGCKLVGALFDDCRFEQLRVEGGDWSFVGLPGADLRRARLHGVRMREADLTGARCQGATITDCDLSGASWSRAELGKCDLRGSDLSTLDPVSVSLTGAIIDWNQAVVVAAGLGLDVRAG